MRHLSYHWKLRPDTAMYQIPFRYLAEGLRGGETILPANAANYPTGDLQGWDDELWPQPNIPFSIFTSKYGSAGKLSRTPFSYLVEPLDDWSRKQISTPPLVKPEQFVVLNNFGSTPGILSDPTISNGVGFITFKLIIPTLTDPGIGRINSITFNGVKIEVAYGYPIVIPDYTPPISEEQVRGCFSVNFEESFDPGMPAGNVAYGLSSVLINSLYYPSNPDNYVTSNPDNEPCCPPASADDYGYLGVTDIQSGVVGLYIPTMKVVPTPAGYPNKGWTYNEVFISLVNYGVNMPTPSLVIGYFDSYTEFGGSVEKFITADVYATAGVQPPAYSDGSASITYPNNNNIDFLSDYTPNGFINVVVNDKSYYENPDGTTSLGISGDAAPWPVEPGIAVPQYSLRPNIYVLAGQTFDIEYTVNTDMPALATWLRAVGDRTEGGTPADVRYRPATLWDFSQVFFDYWLFEGAEALICQKLIKLGIEITPDSVDWYKQMILNMEGLETDTYEKYLKLTKEWKKRQDIKDAAYQKKRSPRARIRGQRR